jgi:hypothetical protein
MVSSILLLLILQFGPTEEYGPITEFLISAEGWTKEGAMISTPSIFRLHFVGCRHPASLVGFEVASIVPVSSQFCCLRPTLALIRS